MITKSAGDNDWRSKRFCSNAVLCASVVIAVLTRVCAFWRRAGISLAIHCFATGAKMASSSRHFRIFVLRLIKWNLFSCSFTWHYLFCMQSHLQLESSKYSFGTLSHVFICFLINLQRNEVLTFLEFLFLVFKIMKCSVESCRLIPSIAGLHVTSRRPCWWCVRVKNKSVSLLWQLNPIFM